MEVRHISADALRTALVSRKLPLAYRWCAMSAHTVTQGCRQWASAFRLPAKSVACPMDRGYLSKSVERVRSQGSAEVRRTFGVGIRAVTADNLNFVSR